MAQEIKEVHELGIEIALRLREKPWRGEPAAEGMIKSKQTSYRYAWTVMNALCDG